MVSAASSRVFPSPRSRPFALLSALFRLRCHGVGAGMFMLRAWGNGACAFSHNRGVFRFLCHGMNSAGGGGCRAGRMASAGRCAYFYRLARPLPLGAGDYVRPAGIGSACGEGVGVSSRFSLSHCSSSCHLVAPVVIASLCLLRRPVPVVPCSNRSRLPCPVLISCRRLSCPSSCSCLIAPCSFVLSSPFFYKRGRGAWRLVLACSFLFSSGVPRRAGGGRCRLDGVGGAGLLLAYSWDGGRAMRCCRLWLCRVCVVVVCIYKLNACSCIMDIVERKRTRKDFDDERDGSEWRVGCSWSGCFAANGHRSCHGCRAYPDLRIVSCCDGMECVSSRQVLREPIAKTTGGGRTKRPRPLA